MKRKTEVVSVLGLAFLALATMIIMKIAILSPTGHVVFRDGETIISYHNQKTNPESIELQKNVEAKILIDDIKIKECIESLDVTEQVPIVLTNNTLTFIPKKGGEFMLLCGDIQTQIVVK